MVVRKRRQKIKLIASQPAGIFGTYWWWLVLLLGSFMVVVVVGQLILLMWQAEWDGQRRLSLVVASTEAEAEHEHPVWLWSWHDQTGLTVLALPVGVELRVAQGFGQYPVESLGRLAEQEDNYGLVADTLEQLVGVPVDGWVMLEGGFDCKLDKACIQASLWQWWFDNQVTTNLTRWDVIQLWWKVQQARPDLIEVVDVTIGSWARAVTASDNKPVVMFDREFIDVQVPKWLADPGVQAEQLSVTVVNTVAVNGLATEVARVVRGMGARVIKTSSNNEDLAGCVVRVKPEVVESQTVAGVVRTFGCGLVVGEGERQDIELLVGRDLEQWWNGER